MIKQVSFNINLSKTEYQELIRLKEWQGKYWDKPPSDLVKSIKLKIRSQLDAVQSHCAYCGLELGGTSKGQIEHIAPKAYYRHPNFTFTPHNLVLACDFCNGFDKKGTKDTIAQKHKLYKRCKFNIVHPYFDNPDDHFEWDNQGTEILIMVKNDSEKALNTIEIFELDSTKMNELRAKDYIFNEYKTRLHLSDEDEALVDRSSS